MDFETVEDVVAFAQTQIEKIRTDCDEEVIKYRLQAQEANNKLTALLDEEKARVRQATEAAVRASNASHIASLEADLQELRVTLSKKEAAAKKREKDLTQQKDEALSKVANLKREILTYSDLKEQAERDRKDLEVKLAAALEDAAQAKAAADKFSTQFPALQSELSAAKSELEQERAARTEAESQLYKAHQQLQLLTSSMGKAMADRDSMEKRLRDFEYRAAEAEAVVLRLKAELSLTQRTAQALALKAADALPDLAPRPFRPPPPPLDLLSVPPSLTPKAAGPPQATTPSSTMTLGGTGGFGLRSILKPIANNQGPSTPNVGLDPSAPMTSFSYRRASNPDNPSPSSSSFNGNASLPTPGGRSSLFPSSYDSPLLSTFHDTSGSTRLSTVLEQRSTPSFPYFSPHSTAHTLPPIDAENDASASPSRLSPQRGGGGGVEGGGSGMGHGRGGSASPTRSAKSAHQSGQSGKRTAQHSARERDERVMAAMKLMSRARIPAVGPAPG